MTEFDYLTIHTLTELPWHNLNRDERGLPKQTRQGGTIRGYLSSQSLKHAARARYERGSAAFGEQSSIRSRELAAEAVARAAAVASEEGSKFDQKSALTRANKVLLSFTTKPVIVKVGKGKAQPAAIEESAAPEATAAETRDAVLWLSSDELDALASRLLTDDPITAHDIVDPGRTMSLPIAFFGRMTAYAPECGVEAAVACGPAVSTHPITIDVDYFIAGDDLAAKGAAHLNQAYYTSGTYYRSLTFDKQQLRRSWLGWDVDDADTRLHQIIKDCILALPEGKKNSTAAASLPSVIVAEPQQHRISANFETAIRPDTDGGYLAPSAEALVTQLNRARTFDGSAFGPATVSGLRPELGSELGGAKLTDLSGLIGAVIAWLRA